MSRFNNRYTNEELKIVAHDAVTWLRRIKSDVATTFESNMKWFLRKDDVLRDAGFDDFGDMTDEILSLRNELESAMNDAIGRGEEIAQELDGRKSTMSSKSYRSNSRGALRSRRRRKAIDPRADFPSNVNSADLEKLQRVYNSMRRLYRTVISSSSEFQQAREALNEPFNKADRRGLIDVKDFETFEKIQELQDAMVRDTLAVEDRLHYLEEKLIAEGEISGKSSSMRSARSRLKRMRQRERNLNGR